MSVRTLFVGVESRDKSPAESFHCRVNGGQGRGQRI